MKLHEMTSDQILNELEIRSDALLEADEYAGECEAALKAHEATTTLAFRDSGKSMAESEKRAQSGDEWEELYTSVQKARAQAAEKKRAYQRAVIASDLYRTERATMRAVDRAA